MTIHCISQNISVFSWSPRTVYHWRAGALVMLMYPYFSPKVAGKVAEKSEGLWSNIERVVLQVTYKQEFLHVGLWRPRQCLKLFACIVSHLFRLAQPFKLQLWKTTPLMRQKNATAMKREPLTWLCFILALNNLRPEIGRTQIFQWLHR